MCLPDQNLLLCEDICVVVKDAASYQQELDHPAEQLVGPTKVLLRIKYHHSMRHIHLLVIIKSRCVVPVEFCSPKFGKNL